MAAGTIADLERAFLVSSGQSGSLNEMRKAYYKAAAPGTVTDKMSVADSFVSWQWAGPGDDSNLAFLLRRYYLNTIVKRNASYSASDLGYERYGGDV